MILRSERIACLRHRLVLLGSTSVEDNVILWGAGWCKAKTLTIGKDAVVYAQSGVKDSIEGGKVYFGSPVEDARGENEGVCMDKANSTALGRK